MSAGLPAINIAHVSSGRGPSPDIASIWEALAVALEGFFLAEGCQTTADEQYDAADPAEVLNLDPAAAELPSNSASPAGKGGGGTDDQGSIQSPGEAAANGAVPGSPHPASSASSPSIGRRKRPQQLPPPPEVDVEQAHQDAELEVSLHSPTLLTASKACDGQAASCITLLQHLLQDRVRCTLGHSCRKPFCPPAHTACQKDLPWEHTACRHLSAFKTHRSITCRWRCWTRSQTRS